MKEQLQIDFDNIIKTSSFTKRDIELKQKSLNEFIKTGFPSRRQENWKFSDLNQIIKKILEILVFITIIHPQIRLTHQFLLMG